MGDLMFACVDCLRFRFCDKNSEEWEKAKKLYPVDEKVAENMKKPQTREEKLRLEYINNVAGRCQERVTA
jgi:hypothetical protein